MKNRLIPLLMISTIAQMTVSCTEDDIIVRSENRIRPVVSASSTQTRSGLSGEDVKFIGSYTLDSFGADTLCIAVYELDNRDLPKGLYSNTGLQTRGTVVTDAGINQVGQQFTMNAWLESQNRNATNYHFMKEATATYEGTDWTLSSASSSEGWDLWRNKVPTNFWAMYPTSLSSGTLSLSLPADNASDDAQKTLSFDYTLPAQSTDFTDAEKQQDLCFAYSRKTWDEDVTGNDDYVNIRFYHALSAMYFDISGVSPHAPVNSIKVNKIGFKNVPSSAHCVMTGTSGTSAGNPGEPAMTWSGQTSLKDYKQAYLSTDFNSSNILKVEESKVFMMIPGVLDDKTELWAEFEVDGETVEKSVNISEYSDGTPVEWEAGKIYLYRLIFTGNGDQFTLNLAALPWNYSEPTIKYDEEVEIASALQFDKNTCTVDETNHKVYFKGANPITGSFKLSSPADAMWFISKEGDYDAFEIDNTASGRYGDGIDNNSGTVDVVAGNSFTLYPKDVASGRDYSIQLSFSVRYTSGESYCIDDKVQIDDAEQPVRWTIILTK